MAGLIVIPFGVFFACCLSQFWFLAQVRNALIDRHPETFLSLERSSIFPGNGIYKFIRTGKHRDLGDAELSKAVIRCRWLFAVAIVSWLAIPGVAHLVSRSST